VSKVLIVKRLDLTAELELLYRDAVGDPSRIFWYRGERYVATKALVGSYELTPAAEPGERSSGG
jgi:hypothetical protein